MILVSCLPHLFKQERITVLPLHLTEILFSFLNSLLLFWGGNCMSSNDWHRKPRTISNDLWQIGDILKCWRQSTQVLKGRIWLQCFNLNFPCWLLRVRVALVSSIHICTREFAQSFSNMQQLELFSQIPNFVLLELLNKNTWSFALAS